MQGIVKFYYNSEIAVDLVGGRGYPKPKKCVIFQGCKSGELPKKRIKLFES